MATLADDSTPLTPSPRKKPRCTKCGEPMLGHKRGQCPNNLSPSTSTPLKAKLDVEKGDTKLVDISTRLETLRIDADEKVGEEENAKTSSRRRSSLKPTKAETLPSLASTDKNALDALAQPGMMTDRVLEVDEQATRENIEKWLEKFSHSESPDVTPKKPKLRFSIGPEITGNRRASVPRTKDSSGLKQALKAERISGSDMQMDRKAFYLKLLEKSHNRVASVYTISADDVHELEDHAKRLQIKAKAIFPKYTDGSTGDGWLVIGQDADSIERVFKDVEKDVKDSKGYLVGGAAAMGAIATWMVLAFS